MIGRILMTRVEPCFWGNKPACGEVSRVKKDTQKQEQTNVQIKTEGVDTFTSSKEVDVKKSEPVKTAKK